mgnify:CR=1 FL=1
MGRKCHRNAVAMLKWVFCLNLIPDICRIVKIHMGWTCSSTVSNLFWPSNLYLDVPLLERKKLQFFWKNNLFLFVFSFIWVVGSCFFVILIFFLLLFPGPFQNGMWTCMLTAFYLDLLACMICHLNIGIFLLHFLVALWVFILLTLEQF